MNGYTCRRIARQDGTYEKANLHGCDFYKIAFSMQGYTVRNSV